MRLICLDGFDAAGTGRGRAVERAIANLELDDVLAARFECSCDGQDRERGLDRQ